MSQLNCWMTFTQDTRVSRVWIFVRHFEFSLKNHWPSSADNLPQGVETGPFFKEIHKLSTKTLWNIEARPIRNWVCFKTILFWDRKSNLFTKMISYQLAATWYIVAPGGGGGGWVAPIHLSIYFRGLRSLSTKLKLSTNQRASNRSIVVKIELETFCRRLLEKRGKWKWI